MCGAGICHIRCLVCLPREFLPSSPLVCEGRPFMAVFYRTFFVHVRFIPLTTNVLFMCFLSFQSPHSIPASSFTLYIILIKFFSATVHAPCRRCVLQKPKHHTASPLEGISTQTSAETTTGKKSGDDVNSGAVDKDSTSSACDPKTKNAKSWMEKPAMTSLTSWL